MNYLKIYNALIYKAQNRKLSKNTYFEKHHIKPKCLSGNDNETNIVKLLASEHYVAHLLLCKIYPNNYKLLSAVVYMCTSNSYKVRNNKLYEWIRIQYSNSLKGVSYEEKYGKEKAKEIKNKTIKRLTGRIKTESERKKLKVFISIQAGRFIVKKKPLDKFLII